MISARWRAFRTGLLLEYPRFRPEHPRYRWLVLATVMIATFMAVLDATIVNVALSKLMSSFGVSVDRVEWVLTAYLLVFGVLLPTSGWLADNLGYKLVFSSGLFLFTLGSFLCSLAWDLDILIVFRIVQGLGAGVLMPVGMAIVMREFPPEKRGIAMAFWSMAASASVSLGPAVGGYLIDHYSWQAIFDVNIPVGIVGMAVAAIVLREYKAAEAQPFDLLGLISLVGFLTPLLLALASGNSAWNTGGWTSNYILSCFGLSFVCLVIFLTTELTVKHPLIELNLFANFNFAVSNLIMFLFGLGMFGSVFLLPIYLQNSLGYTPLQAGLVFLPVGIIQGLVAPVAGVFSDRFTPKIPAILGLLLMAYTFYQMSFLSFLSERHEIMTPLILRGVAMGIMFAPLTIMAIADVPRHKMAQASGLVNVIRQIGGSFGVALFGTLLTRRTIYHLSVYGEQIDPFSEAYKVTLAKLQLASMHLTGGTIGAAVGKAKAQIGSFVANEAFIRAVDDAFLFSGVIVLIGVIPLLFIRTRKAKAAQKQNDSRSE